MSIVTTIYHLVHFILNLGINLPTLQELGTDVNLYALVFGESVLNDAVSLSATAFLFLSFEFRRDLKIDGAKDDVVLYISLLCIYFFCPDLPLALWADGNFSVQVPKLLKYLMLIRNSPSIIEVHF
jgi:hypothetical protein